MVTRSSWNEKLLKETFCMIMTILEIIDNDCGNICQRVDLIRSMAPVNLLVSSSLVLPELQGACVTV